MKYNVFVEVNISEFITVEADSKEEAEDIARDKFADDFQYYSWYGDIEATAEENDNDN